MQAPTLRPAIETAEDFGGVRFRIAGQIVPMLEVEISTMQVYFEHHVVMWKDTTVTTDIKPLKGAFKRMLAGMPIFMTETSGHGRIGFSRNLSGELFPLHLAAGSVVDVREHQFLAATTSVSFDYNWMNGGGMSGVGSFIDTFKTTDAPGILWLHGYGNVFELNLAAGESVDTEPTAWIYKDPTVTVETNRQSLATGYFTSTSIYWNRFTGPGRLGIQTSFPHSNGSSA